MQQMLVDEVTEFLGRAKHQPRVVDKQGFLRSYLPIGAPHHVIITSPWSPPGAQNQCFVCALGLLLEL